MAALPAPAVVPAGRCATGLPARALRHGLETVIEDAATGKPTAWFPLALFHIATHPSGRIWAGSSSYYVALFALEGPPQAHAPRTATATRLWHFGAGDAPDHWDNNLTVGCAHCGERFVVTDDMLGQEIECPLCGGGLRLNPFVCDHSDWLR